jgi:hypothetical protein
MSLSQQGRCWKRGFFPYLSQYLQPIGQTSTEETTAKQIIYFKTRMTWLEGLGDYSFHYKCASLTWFLSVLFERKNWLSFLISFWKCLSLKDNKEQYIYSPQINSNLPSKGTTFLNPIQQPESSVSCVSWE